MTDAEIVALAATQVMGWEVLRRGNGNIIGQPKAPADIEDRVCLEHVYGVVPARIWNPLAFDADAFMLVDAIHAKGELWFRLTTRWDKVTWSAGWTEQDFTGWNGHMDIEVSDPDRRRAIVLAAIKATEPKP